ncbi:hypothetical protein Pelo_17399 [Pelomyxa schiedti]|nr:hypothetical protein Pelo_17399 [Pelomyxa schiedti]
MLEWARSPSHIRQWAHDWVLWPETDAVFWLPDGRHLAVTVSPTLGVVSWSLFRSHYAVMGLVGTDAVLCATTNVTIKREKGSTTSGVTAHLGVFNVAGEKSGARPVTSSNTRSSEAPALFEDSRRLLWSWEAEVKTPLREVCNREWIVGFFPNTEDWLWIWKVEVSGFGFIPSSVRFSPLCGDVLMMFPFVHQGDSPGSDLVIFVDLAASFESGLPVVTSRQWACDWVLWAQRDAVFELPVWHHKLCLTVSVSPTLGVVSWTVFRCDDSIAMGCVGTNAILCATPVPHVGGYSPCYFRVMSVAGEEGTDKITTNCLEPREDKMVMWSFKSEFERSPIPRCNKRWIVFCPDYAGKDELWIWKVVVAGNGTPWEKQQVMVNELEFRLSHVSFSPLCDDHLVIFPSYGCSVLVSDLSATFKSGSLVITSRVSCGYLPLNVVWMPDGSLCSLHCTSPASVHLVNATLHKRMHEFPEGHQVTPISSTQVVVVPSKREVHTFSVYHTGDLSSATLCVPCTWASPEGRQWARDWVLWPQREAVFELPVWHHNSLATRLCLAVSVSPTLGVVTWSVFRCDYCVVMGCVGTSAILCSNLMRAALALGSSASTCHFRVMSVAGEEGRGDIITNCLEPREDKMVAWSFKSEFERLPTAKCNRRWIVVFFPCYDEMIFPGNDELWIWKVAAGGGAGNGTQVEKQQVKVHGFGFKLSHVIFSPLCGDVLMMFTCGHFQAFLWRRFASQCGVDARWIHVLIAFLFL